MRGMRAGFLVQSVTVEPHVGRYHRENKVRGENNSINGANGMRGRKVGFLVHSMTVEPHKSRHYRCTTSK